MKRRVVKHNELPSHLPVTPTVVAWLLLDRLHAPGWVWGAVSVFVCLLWIAGVYLVATQEPISILPSVETRR